MPGARRMPGGTFWRVCGVAVGGWPGVIPGAPADLSDLGGCRVIWRRSGFPGGGIAAARENGTRFGPPLMDPLVIADKLAIAQDARAKGRTAEDAARLVGWSRATLYRHQQALAAREGITM